MKSCSVEDCRSIKQCLLCGNNTREILHLGDTPLANEFVSNPSAPQDLFPLNLLQCNECNHVQLGCIVNEERLYRNYLYVSGTSLVNVEHFIEYANSLMNEFFSCLQPEDLIIDIGSNDGTFLSNFNQKISRIGIDPAKNLSNIAESAGIRNICEFFNEHTALSIKNTRKLPLAKVITCNNMFAHNANLDTIIKGVLHLLKDDGVFIFENSYLLDICDQNLLDLIYHEHMHHHHIRPLKKLFDKYGMDIYDVKRFPNHGGSIRVYTCLKGKEISQIV